APAALEQLGPSDYEPWAALGATLAGARDTADEREFFAAVPRGLPDWTAGERGRFLHAMSALAGAAPGTRGGVSREPPPGRAAWEPPVRAALLELVQLVATLPPGVAPVLAGVSGVLGAVVRDVPAGERLDALALVRDLAGRAPAAA